MRRPWQQNQEASARSETEGSPDDDDRTRLRQQSGLLLCNCPCSCLLSVLRVLLQAAQPRGQRAAPDPQAAAGQPHDRRAGPPAPAVERRPRHPQLGGHLLDRQQRVIRGTGLTVRGGGGPPGAVGVPGGGPSVGPRRRTLRSARRVKSGPPSAPGPPGAALARGWPPAGKRSQARPESQVTRAGRPATAYGQCPPGGPALPEGKAGRAGRGVPGGDRRRGPAATAGGGRPCWRAGRAGLPPGTAGINPRLCPPRQVGPARCGAGLESPPEATRRHGPVPALPGGGGPDGLAAGRAPRGAPLPAGSPVRACLAARSALWWWKDLSWAGCSRVPSHSPLTYINRVFGAFFGARPENRPKIGTGGAGIHGCCRRWRAPRRCAPPSRQAPAARQPGEGAPGCVQRVMLLDRSVMTGLTPRAAAFSLTL